MIEKFNFYDIYGYFLPGAVVLLLFWLPMGIVQHKWPSGDWISALLGAVLAYVTGVLLQTFADRVLPSRVERVTGDDARDRYPSQKLLDPYDKDYGGMQLSDTVKNGLPNLVHEKFGIDPSDLGVNKSPDKAKDRARNDAFLLARHYLVTAKEASYVEQYEGMYALTRGITAAFGVAAVYYSGWAIGFMRADFALAFAYGVLTFGLVTAILATLFMVYKRKRNFRMELLGGAGALFASLGLGFGLGGRFSGNSEQAALLVLLALAALLASLRAYRFYKEFTETFAITVWRDFFVSAKKPPDQAAPAKPAEP